MKNRNILKIILLIFTISLCYQRSFAQYYANNIDTNRKSYMLFDPNYIINNTLILRQISLLPFSDKNIKQNSDNIFHNLKVERLFFGEIYNQSCPILTNIMYKEVDEHKREITKRGISWRPFNWKRVEIYRFLPCLEGGLAVQLNHLKMILDLNENMVNRPASIIKKRSRI